MREVKNGKSYDTPAVSDRLGCIGGELDKPSAKCNLTGANRAADRLNDETELEAEGLAMVVHPDTLAALTAGIQSEVASYVFYLEASKKTDSDLKATLQHLAREEKEHFQVLERQYDSLVRSEKWISAADILKQEGLPEISEEMTRRHQALLDEVAKADSNLAILDIALRLEEEACDLFTSALDQVESPEGKEMFQRLARFEQGHVNKITELKKKYA